MEIILLFGAGLIAGAVNSLAGGGSFIAFPALLLAGVPVDAGYLAAVPYRAYAGGVPWAEED